MLCMYDCFSVNEGEKYVSGNNKQSIIIKNRKEFYLRNSGIVVLNLDIH